MDAMIKMSTMSGTAMMSEAGKRMWRVSLSGSGSGQIPCRRAVDRASVASDWNHVGQLALRRKVAGDVLVVGGYGTEFFTGAFVRIEYDNGFSCALFEIVKRCNEVGVAGDEYDAVKILFHVVYEQSGKRCLRQSASLRFSILLRRKPFRNISERQGPDFRPALHRIAEAQRSVDNPSRGSVCIVSNRADGNKWVRNCAWKVVQLSASNRKGKQRK